jgi:antitoxin ParD1/3/4
MPNIHLTGAMQTYAQAQIASGAYANLSEVVRAGIRLLMAQEAERQSSALKAAQRQRAAAGLRAMMESGPTVSGMELKELREYGRR